MPLTPRELKKRDKYYADPFSMPPECDILCLVRTCYNKYENKGSFTTGRGYVSYSTMFQPACVTRMCNGCPSSRGTSDETGFDLRRANELLTMEHVPRKVRCTLNTLLTNQKAANADENLRT